MRRAHRGSTKSFPLSRLGLRGEVHFVDELLLLAADHAGQPDRRCARCRCSGRSPRVACRGTGPAASAGTSRACCTSSLVASFRLVSTGMADLAVEARDLRLDVLGRADVGADGPGGLRQLVEHRRVHVVADAEGEDARVAAVLRQRRSSRSCPGSSRPRSAGRR